MVFRFRFEFLLFFFFDAPGAERRGALRHLGDPVDAAQPHHVPAVQLGRLPLRLLHAVADAAPDGSAGLVRPAPHTHAHKQKKINKKITVFFSHFPGSSARTSGWTSMCATSWSSTPWSSCGWWALWPTPTLQAARFTSLWVSVWHSYAFICTISVLLIYTLLVFPPFFPFAAASILGLSTLMLVTRVALITWQHHKRPLYSAGGPSLSPVEIASTQSRFLLWSFIHPSLFFYNCLVFFIFYCALPWHRRLPASDIFVQTQSSPVIFATVNKCVKETMCKVLWIQLLKLITWRKVIFVQISTLETQFNVDNC